MKTYPVYFYGKKVCEWNPLTQNLMEVLRIALTSNNMSTSNHGNLIVDLHTDKVVVVTKMSGEEG